MKHSTKAFTLIETMVAVAILAISIAGPLLTADRAYIAAETSRDQLIASYLAQEGIEYVRAMRDNEYLRYYPGSDTPTPITGPAWTNFLTGSDPGSITQCRATTNTLPCTLDPLSAMGYGSGNALNTYTSGAPLYLTPSPNRYTQTNLNGSVQTPFTRTIQAIDVSAGDERIVSTVTWSFHGSNYSVTVTDHLTPWQ